MPVSNPPYSCPWDSWKTWWQGRGANGQLSFCYARGMATLIKVVPDIPQREGLAWWADATRSLPEASIHGKVIPCLRRVAAPKVQDHDSDPRWGLVPEFGSESWWSTWVPEDKTRERNFLNQRWQSDSDTNYAASGHFSKLVPHINYVKKGFTWWSKEKMPEANIAKYDLHFPYMVSTIQLNLQS